MHTRMKEHREEMNEEFEFMNWDKKPENKPKGRPEGKPEDKPEFDQD